MKKLSAGHIEKLYDFTSQHYVEYYDVQTELVDHLANAIEKQWEKDENKEFEKVLNEEFGKFGVFGFMEVVEQKEASMRNHYFRLIWQEIKAYLHLPKIIILLLSVLAISWLFYKISWGAQFLGIFLLIETLFFTTFISINLFKFKKDLKGKNKKMYLLENIINSTGQVGIVYFPIVIISQFENIDKLFFHQNEWIAIMASTLFVFINLYYIISIFILPSKKGRILEKVYPELKID